MDSRRLAPLGLFTNRTDIPRYQSSSQSRQPMNYAHVIDSARNMQNQDQIEIVEQDGADLNNQDQGAGASGIQAVMEEAEAENDQTYDSLNGAGGGPREEPDPER